MVNFGESIGDLKVGVWEDGLVQWVSSKQVEMEKEGGCQEVIIGVYGGDGYGGVGGRAGEESGVQ